MEYALNQVTMPTFSRGALDKPFAHYAIAVVLVAASFLLRFALMRYFGVQLTPFIILNPAVMLVALLAGLRPGLLATVLGMLGTAFFVMPPIGSFAVANPSQAFALVLFAAMGVFMSLVVERYRRSQRLLTVQMEERALWEGKALYRTLFNTMDEGFCIIEMIFGPDGKPVDYRFLEINAVFEQQTGLSNAVGKRMREFAPSHEEIWFEKYGAVALTGEPSHFFHEAKALNRFYEVRAYRVDEPKLRQVAVVFSDITERRRKSAVLRESEARLKEAQQNAHIGSWTFLPPDTYIWSDEMYELFKLQRDVPVTYDLALSVMHPEDREGAYKGAFKSALESGEVDVRSEYRVIWPDSQIRWMSSIGKIRRDADGRVIEAVGTVQDITERIKVEQALQQSMKQLQIFVEHAPAALAMFDSKMRYLCASRRWLEDYGLGDRDLLGLSHYEIFPEIPERWKESHRRGLAGEVLHEVADRFYRADGTFQWLTWKVVPWHDASGSVGGIVVFTEDVTDRLVAEQKLRANEEQFQTLANSIPQLCWMANPDGSIFWYNDRWYEYTGTSHEQMEGWGWQSVHDPNALPTVMVEWKSSIETKTSFEMTFPLRGTDGAFRPFLTRVIPVLDAEGNVVRWFGTNTDISEQKQIESNLRRSQERLDLALEVANLGEWEREVDSSLASSSLRHSRIFGYSSLQTDWSIDRFLQHVLPQHRVQVAEQLKASHGGETLEFETEIQRVDGEFRWIWVRSHTRLEANGRPARAFGVVMDITERKQADQRIRQLNRVYSVLSDINQTIVREKDSQAMLEAACRIAVEKGKFRMVWIGMINPANLQLNRVASSGFIDGYLDRVRIDLLDPDSPGGPVEHCVRSGDHSICNDIEHELMRPWKNDALQNGYRSLAAFPLQCEGKIVGVFSLYASETAFFDEAETLLLDELAMDISFALEVNRHEEDRATTEEELRHLNRVYNILSDLNRTIIREKDSAAVLEAACRVAVDLGRFRMAWVGMVDPVTQMLKPVTSYGIVEGYLDQVSIEVHDHARDFGPAAQCTHSGEHAFCNDIEHDPSYVPWRDAALQRGYRSSAALPLVVDGRVIGVLSLYASEPRGSSRATSLPSWTRWQWTSGSH